MEVVAREFVALRGIPGEPGGQAPLVESGGYKVPSPWDWEGGIPWIVHRARYTPRARHEAKFA